MLSSPMDQEGTEDRALIVNHSEQALRELREALPLEIRCDTVTNEQEALVRFGVTEYSLVVLDHDPPRSDAGRILDHILSAAPEALVVVVTPSLDEGRRLEERAPGKVFRFLAGSDQRWQIAGIVGDGLRIARMRREQRDLSKKLGGDFARLQKREKLLDTVVRERTRELEVAYLQVKAANRQILLSLAEAIEAKDAYTKGHCGRVSAVALALAEAAGYPAAELEALEYGSFLHDIGKMGVRDAVLLKPGPLVDDEWKHMRIHPVLGDQIAARIEMLGPMRPAIRNHHERWDGEGYPDKMKGDDIPLSARIVSIADAFDAMITDRPYKKAFPLEECIGFLRKGQGKQFDPDLIEIFIREKIGEML